MLITDQSLSWISTAIGKLAFSCCGDHSINISYGPMVQPWRNFYIFDHSSTFIQKLQTAPFFCYFDLTNNRKNNHAPQPALPRSHLHGNSVPSLSLSLSLCAFTPQHLTKVKHFKPSTNPPLWSSNSSSMFSRGSRKEKPQRSWFKVKKNIKPKIPVVQATCKQMWILWRPRMRSKQWMTGILSLTWKIVLSHIPGSSKWLHKAPCSDMQ